MKTQLPKRGLPEGYRVALVSSVPAHHRVPGYLYVVMGPAWGGSSGDGSFGSGRTVAEAVRLARALFRKEGF